MLSCWFVVAVCHLVAGAVSSRSLAAQTPLQLQLVASGLQVPVLVAAPPGDLNRIFVVELPGRIRIVQNGALLPTPFLDLTNQGIVSYGGELGMLGLAFHPDYATNGTFYVLHSGFPFPRQVLKRFQVVAANPNIADPASGVTLLEVPGIHGNHNGGMIAFGPDRMLYVSTGDGGSTPPLWLDDPQNHAQRGDSLLGKMLRLDVDHPQSPLPYGIPVDNPFVGPGDPRDEIWALGLRNPWRFSFDRLTGDLWIGDVGGFQEEIDFEPAGSGGRNYGWKCMTGSQCNGSTVCICGAPSLTTPLYEYGPATSHSVIGGYVYRGVAIPDLRGTYFFADWSMVRLWSFRRAGAAVTQFVDRTAELAPPPGSVMVGPTAFGEDGLGELYVCDYSGRVFKIAPVGSPLVGVAAVRRAHARRAGERSRAVCAGQRRGPRRRRRRARVPRARRPRVAVLRVAAAGRHRRWRRSLRLRHPAVVDPGRPRVARPEPLAVAAAAVHPVAVRLVVVAGAADHAAAVGSAVRRRLSNCR
jgi:glucose/arabinose dehydrogenase